MVTAGALHPILRDQQALRHHAVDALRNVAALDADHLFLVPFGEVDDVELGVGLRAGGIGRARNQLLPLPVIEVARLDAHQLAKDKVDRPGDPCAAPEVPVQRNAGRVHIPRAVVGRIGRAAAQENLRHGLPEAVDALLDIPHKEQVRFFPRHRAENHVLRLVGILVLVHHDLIKPRGQLLRLRGADSPLRRVADKKLQRPVLQIAKIGGAAFLLQAVERLAKADRHLEELGHQRGQARNVRRTFQLALLKQAGQLFHRGLDLFAGGRQLIFQRVVPIAAQGLQLLIGKIPARKGKPIPILLCDARLQVQQTGQVRRIRIVIGLFDRLILPHQGQCVLCQGDSVRHRVRRIAERRLPPDGLGCGNLLPIEGGLFAQPPLRERVGTHKFIEGLHC